MLTKIEIEYLIEIIENEIDSYVNYNGYSKDSDYVIILNGILEKLRRCK